MARFRSLRWRLTAFYLALLAVLLLVGAFGQYFAAREVLFRTNAQVLTSEYAAVLTAFRKQNVNRPATALRALILSNQFSLQLASRHTSAAIFDLNGGRVAQAPATLSSTEDVPTLRNQEYVDAISGEPKSYYIATAGDGSTHLVVLNVIRNGTKALGLAQLSIPTDEIDQTLRADRQLASIGSLLVLIVALLLSPLIIGRALRALQQESSRMTRLVNDLLTLTRFESGSAPPRQRLQLDTFINQALDELGLREHGVVESRDIRPGLTVDADPEALQRVVVNLAQNALRYAPGAEQRWSVFSVDGRAAIRLEDAGPGISRQDLPHIFERFYRGDKARNGSAGGSGLGLAIARSIVEVHHGHIEAQSEPGKGASFTAWLPLATKPNA